MGMPAELPSVHLLDAYSRAVVSRAYAGPGTRDLPLVADLGTEPALPFFHPSKRSKDDERAPEGTCSLHQALFQQTTISLGSLGGHNASHVKLCPTPCVSSPRTCRA